LTTTCEKPTFSSSAGAAQAGAVADALDLELLLEALRHALDHVRDERPRQAVERAVLAALGRAGDGDRVLLLRDLHPRRDRPAPARRAAR
jgi:hypothetical protein